MIDKILNQEEGITYSLFQPEEKAEEEEAPDEDDEDEDGEKKPKPKKPEVEKLPRHLLVE